MTNRVTIAATIPTMNRGRGRRRKLSADRRDGLVESLRRQIAAKLDIDPDRLRYGPLEDGKPGRLNTEGDHWQIWYREAWRELPWHHEGPLCVTRDLVRQWWG